MHKIGYWSIILAMQCMQRIGPKRKLLFPNRGRSFLITKISTVWKETKNKYLHGNKIASYNLSNKTFFHTDINDTALLRDQWLPPTQGNNVNSSSVYL